MVREIQYGEQKELLKLYLSLHEDSIPEQSETLEKVWNEIINDKNHHLLVNVIYGKIVSS